MPIALTLIWANIYTVGYPERGNAIQTRMTFPVINLFEENTIKKETVCNNDNSKC